MLVCYLHIAREAAGALGTRHSPRPLLGERFMHNSGASRRGNANSYLKSVRLFAAQFVTIFETHSSTINARNNRSI
jgi:hypothetical protein